MSTKMTMTDTAFMCMSKRKREMEFARLWEEVAKTMKIPEEQKARKKATFYSELMLDPRFASLKGNKWDLRNRRTFDEVHSDELDIDDLDDEETEEMNEEENEEAVKNEEDF